MNGANTSPNLCRAGAREVPECPRHEHLAEPAGGTADIAVESVVSILQALRPYCGTLEHATPFQADSLRESPRGGHLKPRQVRYGM